MKKSKVYLSLLLLFLLCAHVYSVEIQNDGLEQRQKLVAEAKKYIGTPYLWGGDSFTGVDCSGFIMRTVKSVTNISLPRTVSEMYEYVEIISENKMEIGDLVFFKTEYNTVSHVGIYIGRNQFIHAASEGPNTGVIVSSLNQTYWKDTFVGAGRVITSAGQDATILKKNIDDNFSKNIGEQLVKEPLYEGFWDEASNTYFYYDEDYGLYYYYDEDYEVYYGFDEKDSTKWYIFLEGNWYPL